LPYTWLARIDALRIGKRREGMKKLGTWGWRLRILRDTRGQDLIEYALIVGFIAVAAGALIPGITTTMRSIFERMSGMLENSTNQQ